MKSCCTALGSIMYLALLLGACKGSRIILQSTTTNMTVAQDLSLILASFNKSSAIAPATAGSLGIVSSGGARVESVDSSSATGTLAQTSISSTNTDCSELSEYCLHNIQFSISGNELDFSATDSVNCNTDVALYLYISGQSASRDIGSGVTISAAPSNGLLVVTFADSSSSCSASYQVTSGSIFGLSAASTASTSTPTTSTPSSSGTSGGSCFASDSMAHTPDGGKAMKDLKVGDKVLVASPGQQPRFEEIFMFSHQNRFAIEQFVVLETAITSLHITPGHFLWSTKMCLGTDTQLMRAKDIKKGDCVWITDTANTSLPNVHPAKVSKIAVVNKEGLYNPHTASGSILVNHVATTTFTDTLPASMTVHTIITAPARFIYSMMPTALSGWLNTKILALYFETGKIDSSMFIMPMLSSKW